MQYVQFVRLSHTVGTEGGVGRKAPLPLYPLRCAFSPTNLKRPTQVLHSPMLRSPPARQQIGKALPLVCFQPQHPSLLTAAFRKQAAHKHKTSLCRHRQACSTMGYSLPAAPNPQSTLLRRHHGCLQNIQTPHLPLPPVRCRSMPSRGCPRKP